MIFAPNVRALVITMIDSRMLELDAKPFNCSRMALHYLKSENQTFITPPNDQVSLHIKCQIIIYEGD